MSTIKNIVDKIEGFIKLLNEQEAFLNKDPSNFSIQLNVNSIKAQIADLEKELRFEKNRRDREIVEVRLIGRAADGTIPLDVLGKVADGFAGAILNASSFIQFGKKKNKSNSKFLNDNIDLRLASISTGSTRLFITAKSSPDLFGKSLSEESLNHSFNLLKSTSAEELTQSASKIGKEGVRKLNKFVTAISDADLELDLSWMTPTNELVTWLADKDALLRVSQSLSNIVMGEPKESSFRGELIGISKRGTFEITLESGKNIKGTYPNNLYEDIRSIPIGSNCVGVLEEKTILNSATNYEQTHYTLISISNLTLPATNLLP